MLHTSTSMPAPGNSTPPHRWAQAGAVGAALSVLMILMALITALATQLEETSEFFLLISCMPLLLVMVALHQRHAPLAPVLSWLALACGLLSIGGPLLMALFSALFQSGATAGPAMALAGCFGLWIIVQMIVALRKRTLPLVLSTVGILAGVAWMVSIGGVLMNMYRPTWVRELMWVFNIDILTLFTLYPLWVAWMGYALWRGAAAENSATPSE